jgi:hypothetical protein
MNGPYGTPSQARDAARHAYRDCPYVPLRHAALAMLMAAVDDTGTRAGDYDRDIIVWLAAAEPEVAVVVAGLISRTHAAGREAGG